MVNPTSENTAPELQEDADAPSVVDDTSAEVNAQEAAFWADGDPSVPEPVEADAGAQETEDAGAGVEQSSTPTPQVATAQPTEQPPEEDLTAPKHSEESMRKAQSAWNQQLEQQKQQHAQELQQVNARLQEFDISARVEAYLQRQEASATPTLGAEEATRFVRQPENIAEVKRGIDAQVRTEQLEQQAQQQAVNAEQGYKSDTVRHLSAQHGLSLEDATLLVGYNDPYQMQAAAIRLGELRKQAAVVNTVPAETSATAVGNGNSTLNTQPNAETQRASLRQKTILEMSDDEYDHARRIAFGG